MDGSESFQAQLAFTTAGVAQPTIRRESRCIVTRSAPGQFLVQTLEDIFDGSCDYALASSLDSNAVPVVVNIRKLAAFVWLLTTGQVAGGASAATEPTMWTGSGSLTENGAASGFIVDGNGKSELAQLANAINYPLPVASTSVKLSVFVDSNTITGAGGGGVTTFEIYKNGVATGDTVTVNPLTTGLFTATFATAFAAGDRFDLKASTPGDDAGPHTITFGVSLNFTSVIPPAQLAVVDTTGAQINLTLRRVDPM